MAWQQELAPILAAVGGMRGNSNAFMQRWQELEQQKQQQEQLKQQQAIQQEQLGFQRDANARANTADVRAGEAQRLAAVNSFRQLLEDPTIDDPTVFDQRLNFALNMAPRVGVEPGFVQSLRPAPSVFQQRAARKRLGEIESDPQIKKLIEAGEDLSTVMFEVPQLGPNPANPEGKALWTRADLQALAQAPRPAAPLPKVTPKTADRAFQRVEAMLDGKPAFVSFDPDANKYYDVHGQDVSTRVTPPPPDRVVYPAPPPPPGTMSPGQSALAKSLADDYHRDSKDYMTRLQAYQSIRAAATDPSAAGDLALIFSFMKMLDPGSTVREGEFANAQNAAGVPDQVRNAYNRAMSGERLNPRQRQDFARQAQTQFQQAQARQRGILRVYTERATRARLNPADVVIDFDNVFDVDTSPVVIPGAGAPAAVPTQNPYREQTGGRGRGARG